MLDMPILAKKRIFLANAGLYVVTLRPRRVIAFQYSIFVSLFIFNYIYLK